MKSRRLICYRIRPFYSQESVLKEAFAHCSVLKKEKKVRRREAVLLYSFLRDAYEVGTRQRSA